ncbi:hypothetical protein PLCT1_01416 [Planctomycetaceae bacterium]|nr:hypothetical protein PLCT1_01416 [Planctomycetaceae bacterium]
MAGVYRPIFTDATRPDNDVLRVGTLNYTHAISLPEDVEASFEAASPPIRLGALALDLLFQAIGFAIIAYIGFMAAMTGAIWMIVFLIHMVALDFAYFFIFEGFFSGQTPGKRICGLRVIRDDGMEIGPREGLIRAFTRLIEFALILLALVPFIDKRGRRLGDIIAGTLVVVLRVPREFGDEVRVPGYFEIPDRLFPLNSHELSKLSADDYVKLGEFGTRIRYFMQPVRMQAAMAVAAGLAQRMDYSQPITPQLAERFLYELYAALKEQLRQLYPDLYQ